MTPDPPIAPWPVPPGSHPGPPPPAADRAYGRRWSLGAAPAFWLLGVAGGLSALGVAALTVLAAITTPRAAAVAVPLALVAAALWLVALLVLADPVERRPAWLVSSALAWGGSVAIAAGAAGGYVVDLLVSKVMTPTFAAHWGAAIAAPYAEEIGKGSGVVMVLLVARPYMITVWSGALYGAVVGVGFTLVEDISYALTAADEVLPDDAAAAVSSLVLRMAVPGLVGHPLFTATAGAGIAYAWLRRDRSRPHRLSVLVASATVAALMHAVVNSPWAFGATELLAAIPGASAMAGYLLVVTVAALPALWWLHRLRRSDARMLLARAAALAPDAIHPEEVRTLAGIRTRQDSGRRIRRMHGAEAARRAARLRRAQVRLTAVLAQPCQGYAAFGPWGLAPPVRWWWHEAVSARQALSPAVPGTVAATSETGPGAATEPIRDPSEQGGNSVTVAVPDRRTTVAAGTVLVAAVAGVLSSPVSLLAVAGAAMLRWRRSRGFLVLAAEASAVFSGYCALATLLTNALYPQ
ncbi:PrsW family intramembrane metalloprotease [Actinoplanes sp. NPDC051346]|uniref:PrsW family intramembrane metalloprotease n=1 Tax=Actinoplanes sp. NPDC051346 TaxID=3155048 RepID=UPI003432B233